MPKFTMDTAGIVSLTAEPVAGRSPFEPMTWRDLGTFEAAYIEALFFTEGEELGKKGFGDLAPSALAKILEDCAAFKKTAAYVAVREAEDNEELGDLFEGFGGCSTQAGRDFLLNRNGHGAGFWDGDWPEPHATALDEAARAFRAVSPTVGDDGRVYL